jgi:hypothetical protein
VTSPVGGRIPGAAQGGAPRAIDGARGGAGVTSDEYLVIEAVNPKVKGYDDAVRAFVDYLHALAR